MRFQDYSFGSVTIDGVTYHADVVIDQGEVRRRRKKPSKRFRDQFGHTPLSAREDLPWECRQLVIGTGAMGLLPVMDDVRQEAGRRGVKLVIAPTAEAIERLNQGQPKTNAVLHLTC